jgi:hypothetical protein
VGRLAAELLHDGIGRPEHLGLPERIQRGVDVLAHERRCGEHDLALHRLNEGDRLVRLRHHWNKVLGEVVLPAPTFMG